MRKEFGRTAISAAITLFFAFGAAAQPLHPERPDSPSAHIRNVTFEAIDNSRLFWNKEVMACDDERILNRIRNKFRHQVRHVPRLPDVEITNFRKIHQHRIEPDGDISQISRRYCGATVDLSDGHANLIYYVIEDEMGFASVGDGVEFCVQGFDRWRVYNGHCRLID